MSATADERENTPERPISDLCLNLENKFMQELTKAEGMPVYARLRPMLHSETEAGYKECIVLINEQVVKAIVPASSAKYKITSHITQDIIEDFTFTTAYGPETGQFVFFQETMMDTMQNFIEGQNSLVFSYGTTGSGKTFTLQGNPDNPGVIPLSFHLFFASVEDQLIDRIIVKPDKFSDVIILNDNEIRKELEFKEQLLSTCDQEEWSFRKSSTTKSFAMMLCDTFSEKFETEGRQTTLCPEEMAQAQAATLMREISKRSADNQSGYCSVWVSFVEIYNENIYDLLQPNVNQRIRLNLGEDKNGDVFVKGLREINVSNSYEALKLLAFGQRNLRIASTKLNYQSSRSHCIFTIKVVRIPDTENIVYAKVNRLSFCDLAGSERASKAHTTGLRLKEAGCINTSLLVLGRCLEQLRLKPSLRDKKLIPFRESKLTRLFSGFFTGRGKAVMITNVSPSELTFDETLHVLRFSAVAKELIINDSYIATASNTLQSITNMWTNAKTNCKDLSTSSDRSISFEDSMEEVVQEKDELIEKLLDLAESLKNNLEREKKDKAELEMKIRQDVYQEYSEYSDELLEKQKQAFDEERDTIKEIYQKRISSMEKMYDNIIKDYKLQIEESDESSEEISGGAFETNKTQNTMEASEIGGNALKYEINESAESTSESNLADVTQHFKRTNDELQKTIDYSLSLETELESLRKKFEDTQLQLESAMKDNDDMKKEIDAFKIECFAYRTDNDTLLKEKLAVEEDIKSLTEDLATVSYEKEEVSQKLIAAESELAIHSDEIKNLLEKNKELIKAQEESTVKYEKLLAEAEEKTNKANDKLLTASSKLEEEKKERSNLEALVTSLEIANSELKIMEQDNIKTKEAVDNLSKEIDSLKEENVLLKEKLKKAENSATVYCKSISDLENEIEKLNSSHLENVEELNNSIRQYKTEANKAEEILKSVNETLDHALKVTEEQKKKLEALETECPLLRDEVAGLQVVKKELEMKLESVTEELESERMAFKQQLDSLNSKMDETLCTISTQNNNLDNLMSENKSSKTEIANLQNLNKELENQVNSLVAENESKTFMYKEDLGNLEKKLDEAHVIIDQQTGELKNMAATNNSSENKIAELQLLIKEMEDKANLQISKAESEKMAYKEELDTIKQKLIVVSNILNNQKTEALMNEDAREEGNTELPETNIEEDNKTDSENMEYEELTSKLLQAEITNNKLKTDLENLEAKYKSDILEVQKLNMELEDKLNTQISSCDVIFDLVQVLEECEMQASHKIRRILFELGHLKEKIKMNADEYEKEYSTLHELVEILEKCETLASDRIKKFHTSSIQQVEQMMDLETCIKMKEKTIEDLNNDNNTLQKQYKEIQASSKKQLQAEKQQFMSLMEDMKTKQKTTQAENKSLKFELTKLQAENEKLEKSVNKRKCELQAENEKLEKSMNKRKCEVKNESNTTEAPVEKPLSKEKKERKLRVTTSKEEEGNPMENHISEKRTSNKSKNQGGKKNKEKSEIIDSVVGNTKEKTKIYENQGGKKNKEKSEIIDSVVGNTKEKTKIYQETDENSSNENMNIRKVKTVGRRQLRCVENVVEELDLMQSKDKTSLKRKPLKRKEQDEIEEKAPGKKLKVHDISNSENVAKPQNLRIKLLKGSIDVNDIPAPSPRMTRGRKRLVQAKENIIQNRGSPRTVRS